MRRVNESSAEGGKSAAHLKRLVKILDLMEQALSALDEAGGRTHVAAHLQMAVDQLQDEIGMAPSSSKSRNH